MLNKTIIKLENYIKNNLDKTRYIHSKSVCDTALELNNFFDLNININQIIISGLGHDCSKWMTKNKMNKYIKKIKLDNFEHKHPELWHAPVSADILKNEFNIKNKSIIDTVRYHTIGKPKMDKLLKLIYISDYIEPTRPFNQSKWFDYSQFSDINSLLIYTLKNKLLYLKSKKNKIHNNILDLLKNYEE